MADYDVLCVGDAATDVFIRLSDPQIRTWDDDRGHWMDLPYGGKVPFDYTQTVEAGGNAANAAVALSRLGVSAAIAAHMGNDQVGRDMLASLQREGVDTHLIRFDAGHPSNRNFVLWYGHDRTILVHHEIYDYHWAQLSLREVPRWLYLSSVGSDAPDYYAQIVAWLTREPEVLLAFQPGTFQIAQGVTALRGLYRRSHLLVCNREEAVAIGGGNHEDMADLLEKLHRLGPEIVVVTDGMEGAYASDGTERYRVPAFPDPVEPCERTGAGDAFAGALVAALVKGQPLRQALEWAPVNSMGVVQSIGSQSGLLHEETLLQYLKEAPKSYTVNRW